ncbi:MAG: menaquinone biosynthesis protein [Bacteroidia bacterium]|nr:menaquinone biosynthesis protein [Bacteroidia bacterium]
MDIALVEYINTRPFMDGLESGLTDPDIRCHLMPPAACAQALRTGAAQVALIPVGALPDLPGIQLLPGYCIGADGPVHSVFLVGKTPIGQWDHLVLDSHSRSSNALATVLLRRYWKTELPAYQPDTRAFHLIKDKTGGVIIGDEAIRMRHLYPYVYDLAEVWKTLTGLPFVFAVWAYRHESCPPAVLDRIVACLGEGVAQAEASARRWASYYGLDPVFARMYLTRYISYPFDQAKQEALALFQQWMKADMAGYHVPNSAVQRDYQV